MMADPGPILDGHNDTLLELREADDPVKRFREGSSTGHLDLPRAREVGYSGGFFAMFVPNEERDYEKQDTGTGYEIPYAGRVDADRALAETVEMLSVLHRLDAEVNGFNVVSSLTDLEAALDSGVVAAIPHLEGAAAISPDRSNLDFLVAAGIRSIGLTWSRPNVFGEGVPFVYPSDPDIGQGLTAEGKALVDACARRGILIDLAHLNTAGFWDVTERYDGPLVVTHAGVHDIAPTSRNLTDDQLDAIGETDGVVGIQFGVENLRPDGMADRDTPVSTIVDHIEYVADRIGIEHVAFGTDFDGCTVPEAIGDVTGMAPVLEAFRDRGFSRTDLEKIRTENWVRVLSTVWGEAREP